jgi:hypothetical protein
MSVLERYVRAFPGDQQRAMRELDEHLDALSAQIGQVPTGVIDNPGAQVPTVDAPQPAVFSVVGIDGKFLIAITNPQDINPQSVTLMQLQIQAGVNAANLSIVHELQSATDTNFNQDSGLIDYGVGPQLAYEIQDPNVTKFWRLRSSFDGQTWNDWQIFSSAATCGPVGVWSGLMRNVANTLNNAATTPVGTSPLQQSGVSTQINVLASVWTAGSQTISYNPGSVDPGSFGTYFIYARDEKRVGGTVTFLATTNDADITADDANIYFGAITTSGGGGGTGSGGGGGTCCRAGVTYRKFDGTDADCSTLRKDDILMGADGGPEVIQRIDVIPNRPCFRLEFDAAGKLTKKQYIGDFTVYRIHLDRSHTFLVGQNGIIDGACSEHIIQYFGGGFTNVFGAVVGEPFALINGACGSHNYNKL